MNTQKDNKKKLSPGWIAALVIFLMMNPFLMFMLIFFGGFGFIVYLLVKSPRNQSAARPSQPVRQPRQTAFDDCPQPLFCFHKDKGEHHVRRGREMDPWDRPDIDIRKYQRNR